MVDYDGLEREGRDGPSFTMAMTPCRVFFRVCLVGDGDVCLTRNVPVRTW